jgi:hypothetical protein
MTTPKNSNNNKVIFSVNISNDINSNTMVFNNNFSDNIDNNNTFFIINFSDNIDNNILENNNMDTLDQQYAQSVLLSSLV